MAWGATITVGEGGTYPATDAGLNQAIAAASAGDVIELTSDIAYATNGTGLIDITKSITLDGQGHTIWGYGVAQTHVSGSGQNHKAVIAVNANVFDAVTAPTLDVTFKNLTLGNFIDEYTEAGEQKAAVNARFYGIISYDGVQKLTIDNITIKTGVIYDDKNKKWVGPGNQQPLCFNGINTTPLQLTVKDSYIGAGNGAYPVYVLKPITANLTNVTTEGWCALYFKYRYQPCGAWTAYGAVAGTRGSVVTANNCAFNAPNIHEGQTNGFAVFPLEDDGITLNLNNCSMNAERFTAQAQMVFSLQYGSRPVDDENLAPVVVNISGDNTHLYNVELGRFALSGWNTNDDDYSTTYTPKYKNAPLHINITGGTFTVDPSQIKFRNYNNTGDAVEWEYAYIDPAIYEVNQVSQGSTPVWRVVKIAKEKTPGVKYDLNDLVTGEGVAEGNNPVSSFDLSTGSQMTLNQETTTAGYVEVKDNGSNGTTVTVGKDSGTDKDQKLIINNGLDVQGNSKVEVKVGSTLEIGEGGIVTEKPENIVIGADENGAASLIMDPTITVNQTPNLTVKMKAKQIGADTYGKYHWHRFAMPVAAGITSWQKEGTSALTNTYPTYLYGWDYVNNQWLKLTKGVKGMVPLMGYTLTLASDEIKGWTGALEDVTYIFKGNLVGNTNQALNFQAEGFNFFGNSYTGYMDVLTLIQGLESNNVEGTVYMWCNDPDNQEGYYQSYVGVSLYRLQNLPFTLASWQKEVAPMQTFILRLRGADSANEEVDYASAIWGNPRYGHPTPTSAPRRMAAALNDNTYMEIVVKGANGKGDCIDFAEDANHTDSFESGYDVVKYMNENRINLYTTLANENFSSVVTDNVLGKTINIQTTSDINYTMTFKNLFGNEYAIRDNATGKVINMEEGASYEFSAQPNSTVEGRFEIVNVNKAPTAIENTEVKANVKGIYTLMGQYVGEDFNTLPAGVYVVDGVKIVK